eukprot:81791_1
MSFQQKISEGIEHKYGHTLSNAFDSYCKSEKISDETLYYDLTQMTYKWSIIEVFLLDVLLLKNKDGKKIHEFMTKLASEQSESIPKSLQNESINNKPISSKQNKTIKKQLINKQSKTEKTKPKRDNNVTNEINNNIPIETPKN